MTFSSVNRLDLPPLAQGARDKSAAIGERLDLVSHVKVKLTVTLGGAEINLGQLFSLCADEVIALDRGVDAPVDVRLNDKVIARGTLVAVGDQFGVRVSEVLPE
ncbi:MAG TPA: FliM/FliN family flagellar motor switch protein [Steroidobacteraceae bacterium]|nr:FliM/FliN family flagellar motor switch protein [Steroidobacteraceae bacterium]